MKPKTAPTKYPGVFKTPDGWYLVVNHTGPDGRQVRRRKTLDRGTAEDAAKARAAMVEELRQGEQPAPPPLPLKPTLSVYAARWLAAKRDRLKASVRAHYQSVVESRIPPDLLDRPIDSITRADVDTWATWVEAHRRENGEQYSGDTLGSWWRPICMMLRDAAADHGFGDPTYRVKPPKGGPGRKRERRTLTEKDLRTLVEAFAEKFPSWSTEVRVMAFSGMRAGELYALEWSDIDEAAGVIHVTRAVWHGHVGTTKTDDPRDIALTKGLRALLEAHKERQKPAPEGCPPLVFPGLGGRFRGSASLYNKLRAAGEAAGLPLKVGPQVLRRTFNTLMMLAGTDRIVLRSQMGHSEEEMTETYTHVHAEEKRRMVERMEGRVLPKGTPRRTPKPKKSPKGTPTKDENP